MKKIYCLLACFLILGAALAQKSPEEFLGYELGERFTPHHRVHAYFEHLAETLPNVELEYYGETYEHRPLFIAILSSPENMKNLENIRKDNLRRTGMEEGTPSTKAAINWMQYNVHGNEAVATEAAMMTFWEMANPSNGQAKEWLQNQILIIDPCANPDGKDRYTMWYNQKQNNRLQPDPQSVEHFEPWPGGRPNHYLLDLNRDWAWQTQKETKQRLELYHKWMPHLFVDYHEQGINDPFYFAPAAKPLHELISPFQYEFQEIYGKNTAEKFDEQGWFYFTKERFDLLYPAYGDTWPTYNGAIGMTIEKGGSGRAGLGMLDAMGDTVTLRERIEHQHIAGVSAVEVTAKNAERLADEFAKYFKNNSSNPSAKYKSFVIKGDQHPERVKALLSLLDKNKIQYGMAGNRSGLKGLDYETGKSANFSTSDKDIIVNAYQPKAVLTEILFEPEAKLQDSLTYDITSWALPYAYGVKAYAMESRLDAAKPFEAAVFEENKAPGKALAYIAPWNATVHARFLAALLNEGIRPRFAEFPFEIGGNKFEAGTLIIHRNGNQYVADFDQKVADLANKFEIRLTASNSAYVDAGKDFGSPDVRPIKAPKVALIGGSGVSSLNFGEIWYFFEQELDYPLSILEAENLGRFDLSQYDVMLLPSSWGSSLNGSAKSKVMDWIKAGGKLIAFENALNAFADQEGFDLRRYDTEEEKKAAEKASQEIQSSERLEPYQERERLYISNTAAGAIYEVKIDGTHPLGFGMGGKFYTLKNNGSRYAYLNNGVNVGTIPSTDAYRFGYIGKNIKPKMADTMVYGLENQGSGQVIYMVDNPMFRAFWESGKLLVANAVFLVGQ
ncbi:Peptidase M14, carboxypeptidase A precursor [Indibacter alkaliphilus LW1]|uniref:Peptidase M14, carboxypeptidase A n=1 Tax=Indibacter alkaliphilus (strain CCUG 57479 / KCTC 22604 / LW1) TaxID=1189612 RepID=S2E381_INDAL|nr:M14 family zinc carboxypeptidase [Indibacter alkaliphilus]EOZ96578.1 Peptidase M14, carboxypeptidase A precursor [Indibacter alkaliphilus LW1]